MTDIQVYIESGVIEEYCLGLLSDEQVTELNRYATLHPAIRLEIELTETTLAKYAASQLSPRAINKHRFIDTITNLTAEENLQLHNLPRISAYSDAQKWLAAVGHIRPTIPIDTCVGHVLTMNSQVEQYFIWLEDELVEDAHNALQESFLILEGTCTCNLGGKISHLSAGDFLEIPMFTHHTIRNTTAGGSPIKAIVQRILETA